MIMMYGVQARLSRVHHNYARLGHVWVTVTWGNNNLLVILVIFVILTDLTHCVAVLLTRDLRVGLPVYSSLQVCRERLLRAGKPTLSVPVVRI